MKLMFLDESGHHNLDPDKIDPKYPIFVLCGVIFDEKYYQDEVVPRLNKLKVKFFGSKVWRIMSLDPYLFSFNNLLDEFIPELGEGEQGKIIAEKRNDLLDNQLELAWLNLKINGTENIKGSEIKDKIENLHMIPKSANEAGLQLADLLANPVGRFVLDIKKSEPGHEIDYAILEKKLRSSGLIILPK